MQIKKNSAEFVNQFGQNQKILMLFGPNQQLVGSFCQIIKAKYQKLSYEISNFDYAEIKSNLTGLWEKINVPSLFAVKQLTILDIENSAVKEDLIKLLESMGSDVLLLIRAGDLSPGHLLRKYIEASSSMASIGCYEIDANMMRRLAIEKFQEKKLEVPSDLIRDFVSTYKDPLLLENDIEILDLWMGSNRNIERVDFEKVQSEASDYKFIDLAYAVALNNKKAVIKIFNDLVYQGVAHITIIRAMLNFFYRMYSYKALLETMGSEAALIKIFPPVYFKEKPEFLRAVSVLSLGDILKIVESFNDLELIIKQDDKGAKQCFEYFLLNLNETSHIYSQIRDCVLAIND